MSFIVPGLLAALPLALLPIAIHLFHRRRHRTIEWAAMRFLIEAARAARGWQRLRHILILTSRVVAVAALILAISRPIAGGWLGFALGERVDAVLVLLDRSASMGERDLATGRSKLEHGLAKLADGLARRPANRWILLDPLDEAPRPLDRPADLRELPLPATAITTDIAALFTRAIEHIRENQFGQSEIWVLTDAQAADWSPESGRWRAIREELAALGRVRVLVLAYRELAAENLSVRVEEVRRHDDDAGSLLELDIEVLSRSERSMRLPVEISLGGATSVAEVELAGGRARLEGHRVPLPGGDAPGLGFVAIPADARPGDDKAWFVHGREPVRRTVCVAEDPELARIIAVATRSPRLPTLAYEATVLRPEQADQVPWREVSLVVWQAPLPAGERAAALEALLARGGSVLFLPPAAPDDARLWGIGWDRWLPRAEPEPVRIDSWQDREDLLADTADGEPLPVGELLFRERCAIAGSGRVLARFADGSAALVRATTDAGSACFLATHPRPGSSTLAQEGVVLYAILHRAIESGMSAQRAARRRTAGAAPLDAERIASDHPEGLSSERAAHAGVLRRGDELVAVVRAEGEDSRRVLDPEAFGGLFGDTDWTLVDDSLDAAGALLRETWRLFLAAMLAALLIEGVLCWFDLPRPEPRRRIA